MVNPPCQEGFRLGSAFLRLGLSESVGVWTSAGEPCSQDSHEPGYPSWPSVSLAHPQRDCKDTAVQSQPFWNRNARGDGVAGHSFLAQSLPAQTRGAQPAE